MSEGTLCDAEFGVIVGKVGGGAVEWGLADSGDRGSECVTGTFVDAGLGAVVGEKGWLDGTAFNAAMS